MDEHVDRVALEIHASRSYLRCVWLTPLGGRCACFVGRVHVREIQEVWPCDVLTTDLPINKIGQFRAHVLRKIRAGLFDRCHA